MSVKINLERINDAVNFKASNVDGSSILMDGSPDLGGQGNGVRPMQTLLMGLAGCSAIDMVMILDKMRQQLDDISIDVEGFEKQMDGFKEYEKIHMTFHLFGDIKAEKAKKAAELSVKKYCSVAKTLEKTSEITYSLHLNSENLQLDN